MFSSFDMQILYLLQVLTEWKPHLNLFTWSRCQTEQKHLHNNDDLTKLMHLGINMSTKNVLGFGDHQKE